MELPGAWRCHILIVYLWQYMYTVMALVESRVLRKHFLGVDLFHCYQAEMKTSNVMYIKTTPKLSNVVLTYLNTTF